MYSVMTRYKAACKKSRLLSFGMGVLPILAALLLLGGCQTVSTHPYVVARNAEIAHEPLGNYFIGRRYYVRKIRAWGYIRRPRQPWDKAKLAVINERVKRVPDRLPEGPGDGLRQGYDHNVEYTLHGFFTGEKVYDPNLNAILPEFVLQSHQVRNESPGWLFSPKDTMDTLRMPRRW